MNEEQLYDPIGKWLINEKGCQRDEYSQGYLKNISDRGCKTRCLCNKI